MGTRFSSPVQTGPGAHTASCKMGTGSFPGVKSGRGVTLTPHPFLMPWSRKSRAIPLLPYGPYSPYRASVPVQECTLPFLPSGMGDRVPVGGEIFRTCPDRPWGPPSLLYNGYQVFPGDNCGRGVTLTPHPLLVPWSRKSRAIPLLPLTSRTACTEPQWLTRMHFTHPLHLWTRFGYL